MRLIDADELKKELKDMDVVLVNHNVEDWIDEQPTVEAEPVRHGKWEEHCQNDDLDSPVYVCSECKVNVSDFEKRWLNYCPNCGAKMDLEGDNG